MSEDWTGYRWVHVSGSLDKFPYFYWTNQTKPVNDPDAKPAVQWGAKARLKLYQTKRGDYYVNVVMGTKRTMYPATSIEDALEQATNFVIPNPIQRLIYEDSRLR